MQITFASILWSVLGICSMIGLYYFNHRTGLFSFITNWKFLLLFAIASLIGMRGGNTLGVLILTTTIVWMIMCYKPYMERCRRLKHFQQYNHR